MGCPKFIPEMGSRDLTDGTWIFPEGLVHYLKHHAIRPETDFLNHARQAGFHLPELTLPRLTDLGA
jgi:hypothetical protein